MFFYLKLLYEANSVQHRNVKFTSCRPSQAHYNPTIIYFTSASKNVTQFVKVLLVKLSEMLHSSNFIRLFHRQSFALYGSNARTYVCTYTYTYVHTYTHSYTFTQIHANTNTYTQIPMHIHRLPQTRTHTHRQTDRQTDTQTDRHTHTHTLNYTNVVWRRLLNVYMQLVIMVRYMCTCYTCS